MTVRFDIEQRLHTMKDIPHQPIKDELPAAYWAGLFDVKGCIFCVPQLGLDVSTDTQILSCHQGSNTTLVFLPKAEVPALCRNMRAVLLP